jgi:hypothetical protein
MQGAHAGRHREDRALQLTALAMIADADVENVGTAARPVTLTWRHACLAIALAMAVLGCGAEPAPAATSAPRPAASAVARPVDGVAARAAALVSKAESVEPAVTPVLVAVASELGGAMIKLEHRLKTRASTERKLRKILAETSPRPALEAVELDDLLRYTIRFDDQPPGHYMEAASETLRRLEARGHLVERVKNYWPADDNYSGIHTIFRAPSGLAWELQFHTPASLDVQARTRDWYEELRREDTPAPRKRELFKQMTQAWNAVPIPVGALDIGKNHPRAQVVQRSRP